MVNIHCLLFSKRYTRRIFILENADLNQSSFAIELNNFEKGRKTVEEFINEIITAKKDINNEVFLDYFKYQNPSFLVKDLISAKQNKNEKLVNIINNRLIDLRNGINRKEIPENENWKKVVNIIEKIPKFNKQQKGQGIKI